MADALVGLIMGSKSDWDTMQHAAQILEALGVPHETKVVSAHRTPDLLFEYAESAEKRGIGIRYNAHVTSLLRGRTGIEGVHAMVEKPISAHKADAERLIAADHVVARLDVDVVRLERG